MSVLVTKSRIFRSSEALFSSGHNPFRKPSQRRSHYHPSPEKKISQSYLEMPLGASCLVSSKDGLPCQGIRSRIPVMAASPPTRQAPARRGKTRGRAPEGRASGSSKKVLHVHVDTTRGLNASERKMLVKQDDDIRDTEVCVSPDAVSLDGRSSTVGDREVLPEEGGEEVRSGEAQTRVDQHEPHVGDTSPDFPPLVRSSSSCSLGRLTMPSNSRLRTDSQNAEEVQSRQPSIEVDQHEPYIGGNRPRLSQPDFSVGVMEATSECSPWSDIYGAAVLESCEDRPGRHLREGSRRMTSPSQMKSNTDEMNKEWTAYQTTTLGYEEFPVRDLQKRAEQLLEKSNRIVNGASSERRYKTDGIPGPLGVSSAQRADTSQPLSSAGAREEFLPGWHHPYNALVPPSGDIRPEDDVLYQWRLRRQTEMANKDLQNRLARLPTASGRLQHSDTPLSNRLVFALPQTPTVSQFVGHYPRTLSTTESFPSMTSHLHLTYDLVPCPALQLGLGHVEQRAVGGSDGRLAGDAGSCDRLVTEKSKGRSFNSDEVSGRLRECISEKNKKLMNSKIVKEFEQSKGVANRRDVLGGLPGNGPPNRTRRRNMDSGNKLTNEQRDNEVKENIGDGWRRSEEWHKNSLRDKRTGEAQPTRDGERQRERTINTKTQGCTKMAPRVRSPIHVTLGEVIMDRLFTSSPIAENSTLFQEQPVVNEEVVSSTETMEGTSFSIPSAFAFIELAEDSDGSEFPEDNLLCLLRKQRASVLHKMRRINKRLLDMQEVRNLDANPVP
uniref:uncharacterized protein isoform X2 n=1 Tax=Myxine glutinosa TaxID=7769 RepID=UPI00358E57F9